MNTKEFVKELINTISDEYIDTYKQIYSSTLIDNKIKEDPYWFDALTFINLYLKKIRKPYLKSLNRRLLILQV